MTSETPSSARRAGLLRLGVALEYVTLGWNVVGVAVLAAAAFAAGSVALTGFALDSLVEIGASTLVIWHLRDTAAQHRERMALRLIGYAFFALATYVAAQALYTLLAGDRPQHSPVGIAWTAATCAVMLALAYGKNRTGRALDNTVLRTEGRVTLIDGYLAATVLAGLVLNAAAGWWWADPLAGLAVVGYAVQEGRAALSEATAVA
jgi:divalent metal cation (Fe/Co/Zn/Cd) transporter